MSIATEIQRLQTAKADIKTAIENKGVTVGDGTIDTYAEKIGEIEVGGGDSYYDTFWDNHQQNGERTNYRYGFAYWKNGYFSPKYDIKPTGDAGCLFYNCEEENIKARFEENGVVLDTSNVTNFVQMFENTKSTHLPTIDLTKAIGTNYMFNGAKVQVIEKLIFSENTNIPTVNTPFTSCNNLTSLTIEGVIATSISFAWSTRLDNDSVQSIIDHLKDLTGGTAQTLTLHAMVGAKLTDEQKATITAKNWTLVY